VFWWGIISLCSQVSGVAEGQPPLTVIGIFLVLAPEAILVTLVVVAIPFFTTRKFTAAILIGFALLPLFAWLFEGSLELVRYVLAIDLFMLVRNLSGIKQVLTKGIIKDMIYDRHQKKVK